MSLAREFFARFAGLNRAHGRTAGQSRRSGKGKLEVGSWVEHKPPTIQLWKEHLAGDRSIGVVPITDDGTCVWGAIDVDRYDVDHAGLEREVKHLELPLLVGRSKSGGAHLFLFLSEPVDAELVRDKLMNWAVALGYGGVEVFPKQTRLAGPNDVGNWLNMPYFGGDRTTRYVVEDGKVISPRRFLDLAAEVAIDGDALETLKPLQNDEFNEAWCDGPPCLQTLAIRGFPEGTRNSALFNVAVYLKKRFEDDWEERVDAYNQRFMSPPLGHREVATVRKSVKRKDYTYKCKDQPIVGVCNRQICLTRRFGVGTGVDDLNVTVGQLVKIDTDPPTFIWDVDGRRLELSAADLMSQKSFQRRCVERINKWPKAIKPVAWMDLVNERLGTAEIVEAPPDADPRGLLLFHLEQFCVESPQAYEKDEVIEGRPWTDEGRTYFRATDFFHYLETRRVSYRPNQVYAWLRQIGVDKHFFNVKGQGVNLWHVPAYKIPEREDRPKLRLVTVKPEEKEEREF